MNPHDDDPRPDWLTQARDLLDREVRAQDYALRARLTAVRQTVLEQHRSIARRGRWLLRCAAAAAGLGCLALVAHVAMVGSPAGPSMPLSSQSVLHDPDAELLDSGDSLELYDNLEFYAWLQSQPEAG